MRTLSKVRIKYSIMRLRSSLNNFFLFSGVYMSQEIVIPNEERTWATFVHLSALAGIFLPLLTIVGPLAIWLLMRKKMPFVDEQGKEAVNFQLTMIIGFIICIPLMYV